MRFNVTVSTIAGEWVSEKTGGKALHRRGWKPRRKPKGDLSKHLYALARTGPTVKNFVEEHRSHIGVDCVFVPGAIAGRPKSVSFCGRSITAARYMALLSFGAPKHNGMQVRHLCGNGHLSCIDTQHLRWGSASDNFADMVKHQNAETVQEKIHAVDGKL